MNDLRSSSARAATGGRRDRETVVGDVTIDRASRRVHVGADEIALRPKEFDVLERLARGGYAASGLPATTMGRSLPQDPLFFAAALAAGAALAAAAGA